MEGHDRDVASSVKPEFRVRSTNFLGRVHSELLRMLNAHEMVKAVFSKGRGHSPVIYDP
jgi:hypothetical protein